MAVVFDSDDPGEVEAFLGRAYATVLVGARPSVPNQLRIKRVCCGRLDVGEVRLGYDIDWRADPVGKIRLSRP
ncbi:hypothetical protein F0Q45_15050 [Mycobacterium simiae]|uniref:Uncharacterized protein n=1 Tax=Mycobacterium simiae TaxID=1784 RepID=A0A5B1BQ41_MYCSI|nr:hypothetical protein [Mycobacterium simiae]KAA1249443.1 hypothetical protein F0Q45_15050 [Mycobacterium simiae]